MSKRPPEPIRHVLCGVDGSSAACRAAERAAQLALALNADLTYLAVAKDGPPDKAVEFYKRTEGLRGEFPHLLAHEAEKCLRKALATASTAGHSGARQIVRTGSINEELSSVASEIGVDMVVVGHRREKLLPRVFLGSVAQRLLRKGRFLVVTVS